MSDASRDAEEVAAYYARGLERDRLAGGPGALESRTHPDAARAISPGAACRRRGRRRRSRAIRRLAGGARIPRPPDRSRAASRRAGARRGQQSAAERRSPAPRWATRARSGCRTRAPTPCSSSGPSTTCRSAPIGCRRSPKPGACRRRGGVVIAAAISRFASTLDGLRGGYLEDPAFAAVAAGDRRDGRHRNPTGDPGVLHDRLLPPAGGPGGRVRARPA